MWTVRRYEDAAYYFWSLSMSSLTEMVESYKAGEDPSEETLGKFNDYQSRANVYVAIYLPLPRHHQ